MFGLTPGRPAVAFPNVIPVVSASGNEHGFSIRNCKAENRIGPGDVLAFGHEDLLDRNPSILVENPELREIVSACQEAASKATGGTT